jgi:TPR repeat protein
MASRNTYQGFPTQDWPQGPGADALMRAWRLEHRPGSSRRLMVRLYREAAEAGQVDAMVNLGAMLGRGDGVREDVFAARRWYAKAWRRAHDAVAAFNLAVLYDAVTDDARLRADRRLAEGWYKRAAREGLNAARRNLAFILWTGRSTRKQTYGVWLMHSAADQNLASPNELYNLGLAHEFGPGAPRDLRRAMRFYRKAADLGHADAQLALGYNLEYGIGTRKNLPDAIRWYRAAAKQGDARAHFNLGNTYLDGVGLRRSLSQAKVHLRFAARHGHLRARRLLANLNMQQA